MEFKRRKLGGEESGKSSRLVRRREEDESDQRHKTRSFVDEGDSDSEVSEEAVQRDEESEEGDKNEDEDEDDDEDDEDELAPPRSPKETPTFGELLKKQEKQAAKRKKNAGPEDEAGSKADKVAAKAATTGKTKGRAVSRTSKHAPAEMSSKHAVRRGRNWLSGDVTIAGVDVRPAEMRSRDPRFFLAAIGGPASRTDTQRARQNYAFLDEYRDTEIQTLRESLGAAERAVKTVRKKAGVGRGRELAPAQQQRLEAAEKEAEGLRQQLSSMESRKRDREAKEREEAVLEGHKQRERELVRQGKKPFFLKRSEQRKQLLVDRFASMSEKQVDRAIGRRRKKVASRERREMPVGRR